METNPRVRLSTGPASTSQRGPQGTARGVCRGDRNSGRGSREPLASVAPHGVTASTAPGMAKVLPGRVVRQSQTSPEGVGPGSRGVILCSRSERGRPDLKWKSNLIELTRQAPGLAGLEAVAHDLGYGTGPAGFEPPAKHQ